ncbi:ATP-dependent DNA helicase RecQ [Mycena kentingensis (nom. inval.)]|nr:ATP-dependent DNA helicase RecQ [Mycena kentingensis (nom. inval.)]
MSSVAVRVPTRAEVIAAAHEHNLGIPCTFQIDSVCAQLGKKHVFTTAPTGSGKTLTFWLTLLFHDGIQLMCVNILGEKNATELLQKLGIPAVNLVADAQLTAKIKDIKALKYRVVIASPETFMQNAEFRTLWSLPVFLRKLFGITFDEGHCITAWGGPDFRPAYKDIGALQWQLYQYPVHFHFLSATFPAAVTSEIRRLFGIRREDLAMIRLSNDRPNIYIQVVEMLSTTSKLHDLKRVLALPTSVEDPARPPKFMIFANKRRECESLVQLIWAELPPEFRSKIVWFHAGMTDRFRANAMEQLRSGALWGIVCTDAAGMGLDLPDIELVIQWGYIASLSTLIQRLGRVGRNPQMQARGVYFVESAHFDAAKARAAEAAAKRKAPEGDGPAKKKRKGREGKIVKIALDAVDRAEETAWCTANAAPGSPEFPSPNGMDQSEYDERMMSMLVNSASRGLCVRLVANAYFKNPSTTPACACTNQRCGGAKSLFNLPSRQVSPASHPPASSE